jgi:isopentenyl diphosphate isomerase/L-lactate dehydrogenase-like FMN-dependent dehydrogenase
MAKRRARFHSVDHAKEIARRRLPRSAYLYLEGGTEDEYTTRANREAFPEVTFRPRVAVSHERHDLATRVLGCDLSMPVVVGPVGYLRLAHRDAEVGAARAAGRAGTAAGVSTLSSRPIHEITAASEGPVWWQLYLAGGRVGAEIAIDQAKQAGCRALLVTVDLAAAAGRERVIRGGGIPTRIDFRNALRFAPEMLPRPRWAWDFLQDGLRLEVPNIRTSPSGPALSSAEASKSMRAHTPIWADLGWIREQWGGPIAVKGVVTPEDARRAVDAGVDGIVISNHGGNALDGTPATLRVLPEIAAAVGDEVEVLVDSGFRRGTDVVKALAMGARAVLIGRAYVFGLAAGGEDGVGRVLHLFRDGIARTLALLGCPSVHDLDASYVDWPREWGGVHRS